MIIRPFKLQDKATVRRISCDTANRGEPIDTIFPDREVVADLLTRYYTDYEPNATWVAERASEVVGYLTGCLNTNRYLRAMVLNVVPKAVFHAIGRGALLRRETWSSIKVAARYVRTPGFSRHVPLKEYPAHLHINVRQEFRGQHVGQLLMGRFIEQACTAGVPGIHASVREDNAGGRRFFERMGFTPLFRRPIVLLDKVTHEIRHTIIYGKLV